MDLAVAVSSVAASGDACEKVKSAVLVIASAAENACNENVADEESTHDVAGIELAAREVVGQDRAVIESSSNKEVQRAA